MKKKIEFILVTAFCLFSWPYVFQMEWHWFVESVFDIRHLTYKECFGLYIFIGMLKFTKANDIKDEYKEKKPTYYYTFYPVISLGIGYFAYLIMKSLP
jgi:hypothetical protein